MGTIAYLPRLRTIAALVAASVVAVIAGGSGVSSAQPPTTRSLGVADICAVVDLSESSSAQQTQLVAQLAGLTEVGSQSDVAFGLVGFSDYPVAPFGFSDDVPYIRLASIGAVDAYTTAVSRLSFLRGGDPSEAQLDAITQAASGSDGTSCEWRDGSGVRFVVGFSDALCHGPDAHHRASVGDAIGAVSAAGATFVGVVDGAAAAECFRPIAQATGGQLVQLLDSPSVLASLIDQAIVPPATSVVRPTPQLASGPDTKHADGAAATAPPLGRNLAVTGASPWPMLFLAISLVLIGGGLVVLTRPTLANPSPSAPRQRGGRLQRRRLLGLLTMAALIATATFMTSDADAQASPAPSGTELIDRLAPGSPEAATLAGSYFDKSNRCRNGVWNIRGQDLTPGVYYVDCDVEFSDSSGTMTIVSTGTITTYGEGQTFRAFHDDLLFVTGSATEAPLRLRTGSSSYDGHLRTSGTSTVERAPGNTYSIPGDDPETADAVDEQQPLDLPEDAETPAACDDDSSERDEGCKQASPDDGDADPPPEGDVNPGDATPGGEPALTGATFQLEPGQDAYVCDGTSNVVGQLTGFSPGEDIQISWSAGSMRLKADEAGQAPFSWKCAASEAREFVLTARGTTSGRVIVFALSTTDRAEADTPRYVLDFNPFVCVGKAGTAIRAGEVRGFLPGEGVTVTWDNGSASVPADERGTRVFRWECEAEDVREIILTVRGDESGRVVEFELPLSVPTPTTTNASVLQGLTLLTQGDLRRIEMAILRDPDRAAGAACFRLIAPRDIDPEATSERDRLLAEAGCVDALPRLNPDGDRNSSTGSRSEICDGAASRAGRVAFANDLQTRFTGIQGIGQTSCREIVSDPPRPCPGRRVEGGTLVYSTCWSTHADGRALDLMIEHDVITSARPAIGKNAGARVATEAGRQVGDQIVEYLLQPIAGVTAFRARAIGVTQILWHGGCWSANNRADRDSSELRPCGINLHWDHPHVTLADAAADADSRFPWFAWRQDAAAIDAIVDRPDGAPSGGTPGRDVTPDGEGADDPPAEECIGIGAPADLGEVTSTVLAADRNLRTNPGTTCSITALVPQGSVLQVSSAERNNDGFRWVWVIAPGAQEGWMALSKDDGSDSVVGCPAQDLTRLSSRDYTNEPVRETVAVYDAPSQCAIPIGARGFGDEVTVIGITSDFYEIEGGGFILRDADDPIELACPVERVARQSSRDFTDEPIRETVGVYVAPSSCAGLRDVRGFGDEVTVIGIGSDFYEIEGGGFILREADNPIELACPVEDVNRLSSRDFTEELARRPIPVFNAPSVCAAGIGTITRGEMVTVIGIGSGYYELERGGFIKSSGLLGTEPDERNFDIIDDCFRQSPSRLQPFAAGVLSRILNANGTNGKTALDHSPVSDLQMTSGCNEFDGLFIGGPDIYGGIKQLLATAQHEVVLQFYQWDADSDASTAIAQGLKQATDNLPADETLDVFISINRSPSAILEVPVDKIDQLGSEAAWAALDPAKTNLYFGWLDRRVSDVMHDKVVVVDGRSIVVTGANPQNAHNSPQPWFDTGYRFNGPVALAGLEGFDLVWQASRTYECSLPLAASNCTRLPSGLRPLRNWLDPLFEDPYEPPGGAEVIAVGRVDSASRSARANQANDDLNPKVQAFLQVFEGSPEGNRISIISPNVNSDVFQEAVIEATDRGVKVRLLTSLDFNSITEQFLDQGGKNCEVIRDFFFEDSSTRLPRPNLEVRWHGNGQTAVKGKGANANHAKFLALEDRSGDSVLSIVGSSNHDTQSWDQSREFNLLIDNSQVTDDLLSQVFDPVWATGIEVVGANTDYDDVCP